MSQNANIAVIIASKGRPHDLALWLDHVARQTLAPALMIWSVTGDQDVPGEKLAGMDSAQMPVVLYGPAGLTHQRNAALAALADGSNGPAGLDLVAFFDDDYVPASDCLEKAAALFALNPDLAGATGLVIEDGINSMGVAVERAMAQVLAHQSPPTQAARLEDTTGLYGCNMVMRAACMGDERFDENLPLYGWQEDIDFSVRIGRGARLCWTDAFAGVHRGAKGARVSGLRFGYSQVANLLYLMGKGTVPRGFGLRLIARNLMANHARLLWPEPWVDRRGRAMGNWVALMDLLRGRLDPQRVLAL